MSRTTLTDLGVLCIVCAFAGVGTAASIRSTSEADRRIVCASNLRQLGQALLLYANRDELWMAYPRTIRNPEAPTPVWGTPYGDDDPAAEAWAAGRPAPDIDPFASATGPHPNDVTAPLFLLLRAGILTDTRTLVCPSTGRGSWRPFPDGGTFTAWTNFPGRAVIRDHVSYSVQNPYPATDTHFAWNSMIDAELAVAADMNPGSPALLALAPDDPPAVVRAGNSPNHAGDGQNVLFGDGSVHFLTTPFRSHRGVAGDNIYTFGTRVGPNNEIIDGGSSIGIAGPPASSVDSILLPTATDLGLLAADGSLAPPPTTQPLAADDDADRRAFDRLLGAYVRPFPQDETLGITPDGITLTRRTPEKLRVIKLTYTVVGVGNGASLRIASRDPDVRGTWMSVMPASGGGISVTGSGGLADGDWSPATR